MKTIIYVFISLIIILNPLYSKDNSHFTANHIAVFSGATSNLEHKSTDFSLGLDYEYRFSFSNGLIGVGLFGEAVFAEHTELIAGIPIFIHPVGNIKFLIAPSIMQIESTTESDNSHIIKMRKNPIALADEIDEDESNQKYLIRIGVAYDFHFGHFSFSPVFNTDIMESNISIIYGISFGYGF